MFRQQDVGRWAGVLVLLACPWPAVAADPPKEDADKPAEKRVSLGPIGGVVKNTGGSDKRLVIEVSIQYLEVNPGAEANLVREAQEVVRKQQQVLRTRNPWQRQREMAELVREAARMQQSQQNLFRVKEIRKDVEVVPADDMKVRTLQPPLQYDEKGFPKKYTKDELKEMRGDGKQPGYAAEFDSVAAGQVVVAYLARKKGGAAKEGDKELLKEAGDDKPLVTTLVIVSAVKK